MPRWRSNGFNPAPSAINNADVPYGCIMEATYDPSGYCQNRIIGFSKKTDRHKKNASVIESTTSTQGRNSLSLSQWFPVTRLPKPPSKNDQNNSEPACPPHNAVTRRYTGISLLITL